MFKYDSVADLVAEAQRREKNISEIVIEEQAETCETTREK